MIIMMMINHDDQCWWTMLMMTVMISDNDYDDNSGAIMNRLSQQETWGMRALLKPFLTMSSPWQEKSGSFQASPVMNELNTNWDIFMVFSSGPSSIDLPYHLMQPNAGLLTHTTIILPRYDYSQTISSVPGMANVRQLKKHHCQEILHQNWSQEISIAFPGNFCEFYDLFLIQVKQKA